MITDIAMSMSGDTLASSKYTSAEAHGIGAVQASQLMLLYPPSASETMKSNPIHSMALCCEDEEVAVQ